MTMTGQDSLKTRRTLTVDGKEYDYYSLQAAADQIGDVSRLPFSLKVLLENMLRFEDGRTVTTDDVKAVADWQKERKSTHEIAYRPARVLMQDFTGVPAVVDLAAMREAMVAMGGDPEKINPLSPVDLVIDHSVMVDYFGGKDSFKKNVDLEFERNGERYSFLRWGQTAFDNFSVVPPGTGICHQVNVEYLARTVWSSQEKGGDREIAYPDTLVGTDSHTTMVNGLGVLGWGVGGIEAEAAMLGQPVSMLIPEVVGFKLTGKLKEGMTATDLVLMVVEMLRKKGVVGKFVEFYGDGLDNLTLADRATIANMAPEYGATCGIFPVDEETLNYLKFSGRDDAQVALVKAYAQAQGMWREKGAVEPVFTDTLELDLNSVEPSLAGPKRPQDRVALSNAAPEFVKVAEGFGHADKKQPVDGADYELEDGAVVIAAITSCTNTSNPAVLIGAGLVARKARELGLTVKPWVKTSLAPGSQVVTDYLEAAGLQEDLDELGFDLVGYGCTTCIGNSGPLPGPIAQAVEEGDLVVTSVLSGNRNFEGRVSPHTRGNYLASPPLVVAYALAGNMKIDITKDAIGQDKDGNDVFLKDIWPTNQEIQETMLKSLTPEMFKSRYSNVFEGPKEWRDISVKEGQTFEWNAGSTYVQHPPFFQDMKPEPEAITDIKGAKALAILGDSVTTDHISPAGSFKPETPAGEYLTERQVRPADFNSYGSRRGNHEIMMRGTFANIRIRNEVAPGTEGGFTKKNGEVTTMYDAAMAYQAEGTPLVVVGGKEYGTGSSRDWAAKGTRLLGVKAVIVESFERIHRSNLVGMGVLPLQFKDGVNRETLKLDGSETYDIVGIEGDLKPRQDVKCIITRADGSKEEVDLLCRIDTLDELEYYRNGGILQYVLRNIMAESKAA
ncbi:aconitate hydratase AcnA [Aestuariispira ectoiniformans]|uniref:aconitate hydratase AcnA n=1 Tax=Aestuariispira ectoiniformans TaxID=2775080 RepID=UPI0028834351|nr:aconitate hydratase AcnA [Aestuariispira ectoiniformans]